MKVRIAGVFALLLAGLLFAGFGGIVETVSAQPGAAVGGGKDGGKMKFEIFEDKAMEFRWRLKNAEGKNLATPGQGYKNKQSAKDGIESVKKIFAGGKGKIETYEDKAKQHRWRVIASNGNEIANSSGGFKEKADCEKAIEAVKVGLPTATVEEVK